MTPTTTRTYPPLALDVPVGRDGLRGRLLLLEPEQLDAGRRFYAVYYHGTTPAARRTVRDATLERLRTLADSRQDVERRTAGSALLDDCIGRAIDLPSVDRMPRELTEYAANMRPELFGEATS